MDDIKLAGEKQNIDPMWKVPLKEVDLGEPTSFLDHVYFGCTQRDSQISRDIVDNYRKMFESSISAGAKESYFVQGNLTQTFPDGAMIWKVMQRNVWSDIANWRTEQLNSYTTSQLHALMTINSKKRNWDLLENCQKYALKLSRHACI